MKALVFEAFNQRPTIQNVKEPSCPDNGVILKVLSTGLCLSDWHAWAGHDPDIILPHVPGHELAGEIVEIGKNIKNFKVSDRVTMPFVCGCGHCPQCDSGNHQICDHQFQPGFTAWGSFAEYVALDYSDINLVKIPESIENETAASLGCRFVTSYRAVVDQGKIQNNQWLAVYGCGGVGLSAIMIAKSKAAKVIAVDISDDKLAIAKTIGADFLVNSLKSENTVQEVIELSQGGVHVSIDAIGHPDVAFNSISNLRKQGKHIQVGLMTENSGNSHIPMAKVIANELEVIGSHGMQAHKYPELFKLIENGQLQPEKLIDRLISLDEAVDELMNMDKYPGQGIKIINNF